MLNMPNQQTRIKASVTVAGPFETEAEAAYTANYMGESSHGVYSQFVQEGIWHRRKYFVVRHPGLGW